MLQVISQGGNAGLIHSRRNGRHLAKTPPLISNRLVFVFCCFR